MEGRAMRKEMRRGRGMGMGMGREKALGKVMRMREKENLTSFVFLTVSTPDQNLKKWRKMKSNSKMVNVILMMLMTTITMIKSE